MSPSLENPWIERYDLAERMALLTPGAAMAGVPTRIRQGRTTDQYRLMRQLVLLVDFWRIFGKI